MVVNKVLAIGVEQVFAAEVGTGTLATVAMEPLGITGDMHVFYRV